MNKLLTKIVGLSLGLSMAIGVGVAASYSEKDAVRADAATDTAVRSASSPLSTSAEQIGTSPVTIKTSAANTYSSPCRAYANVTITINATSGSVLKYVTYEASSTGNYVTYAQQATVSPSVTPTVSSKNVTWTFTTDPTEFTFKPSSQTRWNSITVGYDASSVQSYTVSFDGNGASGSMSDVTKVSGSYTLPANGFTAPTGKAFSGWKANNTGDLIPVGGSYTVNSNVTFYAQWADQRTLVYNANGGTGSMTDPNSPYGDGATVTVLSNSFTAPEEMRFSHWNTSSDDSGTSYNADDTFTINSNVVLYAIWEVIPPEIIINKDNITNFGSSYAERDWVYGSGSEAITGKIKAYKNGDNIQMNHNNTCYVYNVDAIKGYITGITFTKISGTTDLTCWVGTNVLDTDPAEGGETNTTYAWTFDPNDQYTYFRVATSGSNGARLASAITITYQKVQEVDPTGIHFDDSSAISMDTYGYGNRKLVATVEPFNAKDKTVTWGSNDSSVATVSEGVIAPVGVGTTTVYATTVNYISDIETPELKASVSVTVTQAEYKKATFVPTSTSAATQEDDYLPSGSVTVTSVSAGQYSTDKKAIQLTAGKDSTFTISGYAGMKITGIDLIMSSNGSTGTGSLLVTAGSTDIFEIETAPFSDPSWNGAYDANPVNLYKDTTDYVVQESEDIVFTFNATINSLYIHSVSIRYLDYSLETWCQNFLDNYSCDATGKTAPSVEDWDDFGIEFLGLGSDLQLIARNAVANESGTTIERAMAKYDYIVAKYGSDTYDNYIGRTITPINGAASYNLLVDNQISLIIIVVISTISLTSVGAFFALRKRKENI